MQGKPNVRNYFVSQRRMLKMCGLSLKGNEGIFYKLYSITIRVFLFIYILTLTLDAVGNPNDFNIVIHALYHEFYLITVFSKMMVVSYNGKKLDSTMEMLETGIFAPNPERGGSIEEIWIKTCVVNTNKQIVIGCVLAIIANSILMIATLIERISTRNYTKWELPFGKFEIFDPTHTPNYELAWLFQSFVIPIAAVIYLSTDFLVAGVIAHICVQYKMLCNSIRILIKNANHKDSSLEVNGSARSWNYVAKKLKENVYYHNAIINLASQFEDTLNMLTLINYIAVIIVLACLLQTTSLYSTWDPRFQKAVMGYAILTFQLFLVAYWGNEVILKSQTVSDACYQSGLFDGDVRLQKGLWMMMVRSQRPVKFTAGKFSDLSLVSFVAVVKASFSYCMVLRNKAESK